MACNPVDLTLRLPALADRAPRVRVSTLRSDASRQRVTALHHPVSLIGSREGNKLRLCHPQISSCHSAIVNTGASVLLRDLGGRSGTYLNEKQVDLVELADGDIIRIRNFRLQVFLSGSGLTAGASSNRLLVPLAGQPWVFLEQPSTGVTVALCKPVATVGRLKSSDMVINEGHVSRAHALLFLLDGLPVVCDLASSTGTCINDRRTGLSFVCDGDMLRFGNDEYRVRLTPSVLAAFDELRLLPAAEGSVALAQEDWLAESSGLVQVDDASDSAAGTQFSVPDLNGAARSELARREAAVAEKESLLEARARELEARSRELEAVHVDLQSRERTASEMLEPAQRQPLGADEERSELAKRKRGEELNEQHELREHHLQSRSKLFQARVAKLKKQVQARNLRFQNVAKKLDDHRAELERRQAELLAAQADCTRRQEELAAWQSAIEQQRNEAQEQFRSLREQADQQNKLAQSFAGWEHTLRTRDEQLEARSAQIDATRADLSAREAQFATRSKQVDERETGFDARRTELDRLEAALQAQVRDVAAQDLQIKAMFLRIEEAWKELDRREKQTAQQKADSNALAARLQSAAEDAAFLENSLKARAAEVENRSRDLSTKEARLVERETELRQLQAQLADQLQQVESGNRALAQIKREVESAAAGLSRREVELEARDRQVRRREAEIERDEQELRSIEEDMARSRAELTLRQDALHHREVELRERQEELSSSQTHHEQEVVRLAHANSALAQQIEDIARREKEAQELLALLQSQGQDVKSREQTLAHERDELGASWSELEELRRQSEESAGRSAVQQAEVEQRWTALAQAQADLARTRLELDQTETEVNLQAQRLTLAEQRVQEREAALQMREAALNEMAQDHVLRERNLAERADELARRLGECDSREQRLSASTADEADNPLGAPDQAAMLRKLREQLQPQSETATRSGPEI